jgi:hypothetical protein
MITCRFERHKDTRLLDSFWAGSTRGHHVLKCRAALGAVRAASLRSAGAFRAASSLDHACAQRCFAIT